MPHRPTTRRARWVAVPTALAALAGAGCSAGPPPAPTAAPPAPLVARPVLANGQADPMIAEGVVIGPGRAMYKTSGVGPSKLNPAAPEGSPESFIDAEQFPDDPEHPTAATVPAGVSLTEAQGMNVLARIRENLEARGLRLDDVTTMRVFLDNPPGSDRADYAGWNRAYRQFFANTDLRSGDTEMVSLGTAAPAAPLVRNQARPTRFALEVQSLAVPGWLVEVEVDAVYPDGVTPH